MPFPGSQVNNTVSYAYWLDQWIVWIRVLALFLICFALVVVFKNGRTWEKIFLSLILASYAVVFFIIALIAAVFGFGGIAAGAAGIAKILFYIFLAIFLIVFGLNVILGLALPGWVLGGLALVAAT